MRGGDLLDSTTPRPGLRWKSWIKSPKVLGFASSAFFLVFVNYLHFGVVLKTWSPQKPPVDRESCTCPCWDTIFKGTYQMGISGYKHMYFNITPQALKMWTLTVVTILMVHECICYIIRIFLNSKIRTSMLLLLVSVVHSHYYSWWVLWGYYNDDFYAQWPHQMFFTLTELMSTVLVLWQLDEATPLSPRLTLVIADIALLHILAGGIDQFVLNVIFGLGERHQVLRDLAFMSSDIIYLIVACIELARLSCGNGMTLSLLWKSLKWDLLYSGLVISALLVFLSLL
ncbi:PREDICTED: uncharacterized protein LOC109477293 [Branchiostoma belcheri]|uniref:Uncharacterized protein LOC109477293 n=1 Tax=Branchiostoma belcheri TaxID=7741 RepID=A0A6P4ZIS6_BRABE|nr:PREDICTED: uncharacterized protein LOC109477293 [Branchiostoma belcheri]KAI8501793.1 hypothetical protein Bbelb_202050 [Branchiostoma belcheri]